MPGKARSRRAFLVCGLSENPDALLEMLIRMRPGTGLTGKASEPG